MEANESKVSGDQDVLSIMFSHITNFAEITTALRPDELVQSLEPYFRAMVDTIEAQGGMVDKYITDAVMAFFGAPVKRDDDALRSVLAGIEMTEALREFNRRRAASGRKPFNVSVGINRGLVTVGTIGTEEKMNYTVIGDPVNLASRLSGLTKTYQPGPALSESLHRCGEGRAPLPAPGHGGGEGPKKQGVKIYTARRDLSTAEREAWGLHNLGMAEYYERSFATACGYFRDVLKLLPGDPVGLDAPGAQPGSTAKNPPPANGTEWK